MGRGMILAITVIALIAYNLVDRTAAKTTHVVGDSLGGWYIQPFTPLAYVAWATTQTFTVGDVLVFNFTTGQEDVAQVTKEAYLVCNSFKPISLKTIGPANFTLKSVGQYYFICTIGLHCSLGQKLAINVISAGASSPSSSPPPSNNIAPLPPPPSSNIEPLPPPPSSNNTEPLPPPPSSNIEPLPPSSATSPAPIAEAPPGLPPPPSLASAQVVGGFYILLLSMVAMLNFGLLNA
ncbi:Cucumber peeling cupredoxin [Melia azedarach]|uniref:Cucumber peeling cupredoxin n=1 Tax=Melia azedarach TaxID=155640 RepID=A0ACC1XD77_MELAZ|nr:Cucumber peeling cupredoxin [Melia azedarach]